MINCALYKELDAGNVDWYRYILPGLHQCQLNCGAMGLRSCSTVSGYEAVDAD